MEHPVVVGVDGSSPGLRAVDWAVDAAARHGCALRVVHGSRWAHYERAGSLTGTDRPEARVFADNVVAVAGNRAALRQPDVKVSGEVLPGDPVGVLLEEGRSAFAVVVGNRGLGALAGVLLGSVGLGVAGGATCPTVVVRDTEQERRGQPRRIVLGVGEDAAGAAATDFAFREARVWGAELHAVHAWRRPEDDRADRSIIRDRAGALLAGALREAVAQHSGVHVRQETTEGPARDALLQAAEGAALLVVGARRRRGMYGLELGLVNHAVLHHAPCPVAVVPRG